MQKKGPAKVSFDYFFCKVWSYVNKYDFGAVVERSVLVFIHAECKLEQKEAAINILGERKRICECGDRL